MNDTKLQEAFFDEAFVQSLFELNTAQEVQAALKQRGIALTLKDIEAIKKQLAAQSDVMDETKLTAVAGGFNSTPTRSACSHPS